MFTKKQFTIYPNTFVFNCKLDQIYGHKLDFHA